MADQGGPYRDGEQSTALIVPPLEQCRIGARESERELEEALRTEREAWEGYLAAERRARRHYERSAQALSAWIDLASAYHGETVATLAPAWRDEDEEKLWSSFVRGRRDRERFLKMTELQHLIKDLMEEGGRHSDRASEIRALEDQLEELQETKDEA